MPCRYPRKKPHEGFKHGQKGNKEKEMDDTLTTELYLTIFVFRGMPDSYYKRHVLLYVTSPDMPNFHQSIHIRRYDITSPWKVTRDDRQVDWYLSPCYLSHVNGGPMEVKRGGERSVLDVVASVSVEGRENDTGWCCHNYIAECLYQLVVHGFQTQEWFNGVETRLLDELVNGCVE